MAVHHSRYGFIITDQGLVALRLTRREIGAGLAANRPRRGTTAVSVATATHVRESSDTSLASEYRNDYPLQWDYDDLEYRHVPWSAQGEKRFTVKLALWCLAMMARSGYSYINYWYPSLNSWRVGRGEGMLYIQHGGHVDTQTVPE